MTGIVRRLRRIQLIVLDSATQPTKFSLALYATVVFAGLMQNHGICDLRVCTRVPYDDIWYVWAGAWGVYAALKWWRLFAYQPNRICALIINAYGMFLFGTWTWLLMYARWPAWFASAGDMVLCAASVWVFARTAQASGVRRWADGE